jgi:5-(carboxyamino)imidazole ribonucleotide mutase
VESPIVAIVMGSRSDWATMEASADVLTALEVPFEVKVVSAHRTPALLQQFAVAAEDRGIEVVIAGAGGAAHLPGMIAANTVLPVLGVPVMSKALNGLDSLLSIVQMPAGVPVGTLAIGAPGATNAGVLAAAIVSQGRPELRERLRAWRDARTADVLAHPDPRLPE